MSVLRFSLGGAKVDFRGLAVKVKKRIRHGKNHVHIYISVNRGFFQFFESTKGEGKSNN
jgi:hypothetical protein